jgi:hypothetical protein
MTADLQAVARRISRASTDEYGEIDPDQIVGHLKDVSFRASLGGWFLGTFTGACAVALLWLVNL